jgi:hypothetical protein
VISYGHAVMLPIAIADRSATVCSGIVKSTQVSLFALRKQHIKHLFENPSDITGAQL